MSFGHIGLMGLANGKLHGLSLQGLDVEPPDARGPAVLKLGGFALRELNFRSPADALAKRFGSDDAIDPRDIVPTLEQLVLTAITANLPAPVTGNAANRAR